MSIVPCFSPSANLIRENVFRYSQGFRLYSAACADCRLQRGSSCGFTLLEVLVVLMLISLAMALLMQGLSNMLQIRERVRDNLLAAKPIMHQEALLRAALSGLTADGIKGGNRFLGTKTKLSGITLTSLLSPPGVPVAVEMLIEKENGRCILRYTEGERTSLVMGRWAGEQCGFAYFSEKAEPLDEWSSGNYDLIQLPSGIIFTVDGDDGKNLYSLFAAIEGRRIARHFVPDYFDPQ